MQIKEENLSSFNERRTAGRGTQGEAKWLLAVLKCLFEESQREGVCVYVCVSVLKGTDSAESL